MAERELLVYLYDKPASADFKQDSVFYHVSIFPYRDIGVANKGVRNNVAPALP